MSAPEFTDAEKARLARIEEATAAPESWTRTRCGTYDCERFGTHRVDMPESWYLLCQPHAREHVPPPRFHPSGDGSYQVRCGDCGETVPSDRAHIVKANNSVGRANRCEGCGQAAHVDIWLFNCRQAMKPEPGR